MRVIVTGTTGMVGEGVMLECLAHPEVTEVLSVSRKPVGLSHPKLREYLVDDFYQIQQNDEKLKGYDACFFCVGITSVGMNEEDYTRFTYDMTMNFARATAPNAGMSFVYVSGIYADSTEKGKTMWARVRGRVENDLMKLPFKHAFAFRPAFMKPVKGQKHARKMYSYIGWLYPILKVFAPKWVCTLSEVGNAMINATLYGYKTNIVEVNDIKVLAYFRE